MSDKYWCEKAASHRHLFTWVGDFWAPCDHCGVAPDGETIEALERSDVEIRQ